MFGSRMSNLVETRRLRPTRNRARYRAIIHDSLNSVSNVSQTPLVIQELDSISEPIHRKKQSKRMA